MGDRPLSEATIRRGLTTEVVGRQIVCLKTVGSTNDWLKAAAAEGAPEGLVVFAEEQTAGRGQAGRAWIAPPGCCLLGSVLLRPSLAPTQLFAVTMLGACAAAGAAIELTGLPLRLKWPNDLVSERGKVGGVLTESSLVDGQVEYAILGVGIDVNLGRRDLAAIPGASSLQVELGRPVSRNALARALLQGLDARYSALRSGQLDAIHAEWRERLGTLGQWVTLRVGATVEGPFFATDVTADGALVLLRPDGSTLTAVAGEVSVRPAPATPRNDLPPTPAS